MRVTAESKWLDGERFVVSTSSGHAVVVDSDREHNTAPGPMELVLVALCTCTSTDVVSILEKKRQNFSSVVVSAQAERAAESPVVFQTIHLVYRVDGEGVELKAVADAVHLSKTKYCSVSIMLAKTATITHEIVVNGTAVQAGFDSAGAPAAAAH